MRISMMMAMDTNRLIGKDGSMPWHISAELKYFKRITMGKPVIMGRKTFDSIGKPLPGRPNIVITRNEGWAVTDVQRASSLTQAIHLAREHQSDELMVIGGASVCQEAMPYVERLYLTVIDHEFADGDTWLQSYESADWHEVSSEAHDETSDGGYRFTYSVLERLPEKMAVSVP